MISGSESDQADGQRWSSLTGRPATSSDRPRPFAPGRRME